MHPDDTKRTASQRNDILALLSDGMSHSSVELNEIGYRYGGRIHELRKLGHDIQGKRAADGLWWYWLVPVKAEQKSFSDWAQRGEGGNP